MFYLCYRAASHDTGHFQYRVKLIPFIKTNMLFPSRPTLNAVSIQTLKKEFLNYSSLGHMHIHRNQTCNNQF